MNLTGTATGTELGNNEILKSVQSLSLHKLSCACFLLHLLFSTKNLDLIVLVKNSVAWLKKVDVSGRVGYRAMVTGYCSFSSAL